MCISGTRPPVSVFPQNTTFSGSQRHQGNKKSPGSLSPTRGFNTLGPWAQLLPQLRGFGSGVVLGFGGEASAKPSRSCEHKAEVLHAPALLLPVSHFRFLQVTLPVKAVLLVLAAASHGIVSLVLVPEVFTAHDEALRNATGCVVTSESDLLGDSCKSRTCSARSLTPDVVGVF